MSENERISDQTQQHVFVTPQGVKSWIDERFCAVCGKYMTDDVHVRWTAPDATQPTP